MALAKSRIPHITYVEEIDVTALEDLRAALNKDKRAERPKLTLLPFLMRAMVKAIAEQPGMNAHFDDEAGIIHRYGGVHIGIATQTPGGLVVPVVQACRGARPLGLRGGGQPARRGGAGRHARRARSCRVRPSPSPRSARMGGVATTPVINHPEVAIVGVNKMMVRPVWDGSQLRAAQDDEPVVELRSPRDRRLGRRGLHPAHQGAAGDAGTDLRRGMSR